MRRTPGNALRPSMALSGDQPINNQPGLYPTEDWDVFYWDVDAQGFIHSRRAVIQLPEGYAAACPVVARGDSGCIQHVRRWGIQCCYGVLEQMGFDPLSYVSGDPQRFSSESGEILAILAQATHFDLPSSFVVASAEHPLLLYGPDGLLRGCFQQGHSYLGALVYLATAGRMAVPFSRLPVENRPLYDEAVAYLQQALRVQAAQGQSPASSRPKEMEGP